MTMNKTISIFSVSLAALATVYAGDITGKVTFKGTQPAETVLPLDPTCGKFHAGGLKTRFYAVGANGGLGEVFVYLTDGLSGKTFEVPAAPLEIDQKDCVYIPYVAGVQAGQKVLVKNSDPLMHNVHVQFTVAENKPPMPNRAQMAGAKPFEYTFAKPEVFLKFKCDVHPWMFSYLTVLDHPFFAVTDKDGNFTIKNVPPGKYKVEAVHRKTHPNGKGISQEITVGGDGAKADFVIELK